MAHFDDLLREFPDAVQRMIQQVWEELSETQQQELEQLLTLLPDSIKPLKDIMALILEQYRPVFFTQRQVAIVGPANVGKSTLYARLLPNQAAEGDVEISPIPGTTRQTKEADLGLFSLIDTPGADAVGEVGATEQEIAFAAAAQADFLVIVFDAGQGIRQAERTLFENLLYLEKPYLVILNKIDLIDRQTQEQVLTAAARNLRLEPGQIIQVSALDGTNMGRIVLAITKAEPALLAAMAEALPEYQTRLAWQRILPAAGLAGTIGLTPLPFIDLVPLLSVQAGLVLSLARIYGIHLNLARAKELITAFGVGVVARNIFRQLSKLGGVPGWVLSAAVASATTVAIGYATQLWFAYGEKPSQAMMDQWIKEVTLYLKEELTKLGTEKPSYRTLRARISQILQGLPGRLRSGSAEELTAMSNMSNATPVHHPPDG